MPSSTDMRPGSRMVLWARACLGAIALIMVVAFIVNVYDSQRNGRSEASIEADHYAILVASQLSRDLHSLEQALNVLAGRIERDGTDFFKTPAGGRLLRDLASASSLDTIFWVFHPNGLALATSIDTGGSEVRISDRDYYKKLTAGMSPELVIGTPVTGKISGVTILPIARGVRNQHGQLVAIVSTSLRLSSVYEAYQGFLLDKQNSIALRRADTEETVFRLSGPQDDSDDGERVFASQRVHGYQLLSTAGVHIGPWRERWERDAMLHSAWLAVGLLLTALLYWAVVREANVLGKNAVLLTEVHHRVKNNLAIVQSLLLLESNRAPPEARKGYRDSVARVEAMGLVHHLVYDHQKFEGIALNHYLPRLCAAICGSTSDLQIIVKADPIEVPLDTAVPLALIMNEVITNSLKHAQTPDKDGKVAVILRARDKDVMLTIEDNGPGLPDEVIRGNSASLGLQIVRELTRQINGTGWFDNVGGTRFTLLFNNPRNQARAAG